MIRQKHAISILFLIVFCGQACTVRQENLKCVPIVYPVMEPLTHKSYEVQRHHVEDSFAEVIEFYEQVVQPIDYPQDVETGQWQIEKIDGSQVLLNCFAVVNSFEVERECIYLRNERKTTLIETVWYLSGDSGPWCEPDLSVIR